VVLQIDRSDIEVIGVIAGTIFSVFPFVFLSAGTSFSQSAFDPNPKTAAEAIEQLVMANRILANEGIFDYLGHVSVRNPENPGTFFISRALAPEQVTKADILEVDFEGKVLTKTTRRPYSERIIHGAIYKARPEVNSVIHAHPIPVITLSVLDIPLQIVMHPASIFYEGVPVYDEYDFTSPKSTGMLVQTKEEGDRVAHKLGKSMAVLMRGHGYNVVGKSVPHTVQAAISLRDNVVIQLAAMQYGKPKSLSYHEAKTAAAALSGPERAWHCWVARVKKAMPDISVLTRMT
jgi:3-hydroxy-2-methylpyridine-4,5-dicarboxylate 4-decarboxylase